jgi:hypothetical protein
MTSPIIQSPPGTCPITPTRPLPRITPWRWATWLPLFALVAVPVVVLANSTPAGPPSFAFVDGLCKVLTFVTDTVAAVLLALAIAGYSLLHAFGEARDGAMGTIMRIGFGGSIAIGAVSAVTWLFSKTACAVPASKQLASLADGIHAIFQSFV